MVAASDWQPQLEQRDLMAGAASKRLTFELSPFIIQWTQVTTAVTLTQ